MKKYTFYLAIVLTGSLVITTQIWADTPLNEACKAGQIARVQELLDAGEDPNRPGEKGCTALHSACNGNNGKVVQLLIDRGANLHVKNGKGLTPLDMARKKAFPTILAVVERAAAVGGGAAAAAKAPKTVKPIKPAGGAAPPQPKQAAKPAKQVKAVEATFSSLHRACQLGQYADIKKLIEMDKDIDLNEQDEQGRAPLHYAAYRADIDIIRLLIEEGAYLSVKNKLGSTPIDVVNMQAENFDKVISYMASEVRKEIRFLVAEADIERLKILFVAPFSCRSQCVSDFGQEPLHVAAEYGHFEIVRFLVEEHDADVMARDRNKQTASSLARSKGFYEISAYLKEKEGEVKRQRAEYEIQRLAGRRILTHAEAKKAHADMMIRLVSDAKARGAEVRIGKNGSVTIIDPPDPRRLEAAEALRLAKEKHPDKYCIIYQSGHGDLFNMRSCLESLHNDVNIQNEEGETALHWAARNGHLPAVKYLIKLGANKTLVTAQGKTVLDYAVENGHDDVLAVASVAGFLRGTPIKPAVLKQDFLPSELLDSQLVTKHFDESIGSRERFKKMVDCLGRTPGAIDNIRKIMKGGSGFHYELDDALVMREADEAIEAFGVKYPDERGILLDFDIQTPTKLIENKAFDWATVGNIEAPKLGGATKSKSVEQWKEWFLNHKRTAARNGSRIWELHSKNEIPFEWQVWFRENGIPFIISSESTGL